MTRRAPVRIELLTAPTDADRDRILALEAAAFGRTWTSESFAAMLAGPAARLYVGRTGEGSIAAFCACWVFGDELHINSVVVAPEWRRRGVASLLLGEIIGTSGIRRATLEVRRSNTAALALYESLGFKVAAIRQLYYENPAEDGVILWRNP